VNLVQIDAMHLRVDGAPTLANGKKARTLLDGVLQELTADVDAPVAGTLNVSLGGVTDGNSVLVSLMLVWLRRARTAGVDLCYTDIPPLVMNLIEFSGLDEVLPILPVASAA
jgi:ABC-type transporter Mla MlaB component